MVRFNWAPYQPATYCYGEPQRGTIYLSVFLTEQFPGSYCGNIYSCRDIVGGSSLSHHAEGRADDQMTVRARPKNGISQAELMLEMLGPHGRVLGMDHLICNFAPWESGRGEPMVFNERYPMGRPYTGLNPHKDHNHNGQTRQGAATMTLSLIRSIVLGAPLPSPPEKGYDLLPLKNGERREDVRLLKDRLNETYNTGLDIAGDNGDLYDGDTVTAVKTHLGAATGHPEGKTGRWVVANQWNTLEREWLSV